VDDGFTVSVPGNPEIISGPPDDLPIVGDWRSYRVVTPVTLRYQPIRIYMIGVGDLKPGSDTDTAQAAALAFLRKVHGQESVIEKTPVAANGYAVSEIEFRDGESTVRAQVISTASRLLIAVYLGPVDLAHDRQDGDRFFSSLSISK
jgi:hypothetical protein